MGEKTRVKEQYDRRCATGRRVAKSRIFVAAFVLVSFVSVYFAPVFDPVSVKAYNQTTHSISSYYYNQLNSNEKLLYDGLYKLCYDAMYDGKNVPLSYGQYYAVGPVMMYGRVDSYRRVMQLFLMSEPEFFFLESYYTLSYSDRFEVYMYMHPAFANGSERKRVASLIDAEVSKVKSLTSGKSDYEKARLIHDYLSKLTDYDYSKGKYTQSVYSAIILKSTVCGGYSKTYDLFCSACGIDCVYVGNADHAWNKIKLGGKWSCVDVTWDDTYTSGNKRIKYDYFLKSDTVFNKLDSHYYDDRLGWTTSHVIDWPASSTSYVLSPDKAGAAPGLTFTDSAYVTYNAYAQKKAWTGWVKNGVYAGTKGLGLRIEALRVRVPGSRFSGGVKYNVSVQGKGWLKSRTSKANWFKDGQTAGILGQSRRLEALSIKLYGTLEQKYDIYYRVYVEKYGWFDWAKNAQETGTMGQSKRIEGVQIKIVKKGKSFGTGGKILTVFEE